MSYLLCATGFANWSRYLQGEPEDIAKEKCRIAAQQVRLHCLYGTFLVDKCHSCLLFLQIEGAVMVEDTSLCFNAYEGLPGDILMLQEHIAVQY